MKEEALGYPVRNEKEVITLSCLFMLSRFSLWNMVHFIVITTLRSGKKNQSPITGDQMG